jgi:RimJ/RimL family protein N-acetyltransferase
VRLVLDKSDLVCAWVASLIPQMRGEGFGPAARGIGVEDSTGTPLGGVVIHSWTPAFRNAEISFASVSPRWLTRRMISGILAYPFDQMEVQRLTSLTPKRNVPARRFVELFGFKREGVVRLGFGDDDMVVSGLLRSEWATSRFNLRRDPGEPIERPKTSFARRA